MAEAARRRAAGWGVGLLASYLAVAFLLTQVPAVPWETAVVLLYAGAVLLWTTVAGRPVRSLFHRNGTPGRVLLLATLVAASYGALTTGVTHLLRLEESTSSVGSFADLAVAALVFAPLVGGIMNALPEEITFRGLYLHTFVGVAGVAAGVTASGVFFSLAHLPNAVLSWELSGLALGLRLGHLALFGALLAWAVVHTGTLWIAILWHAGANYTGVLLDTILAPETVNVTALQLWGLAFLVGEAALLWTVVRYGWGPRARHSRDPARPTGTGHQVPDQPLGRTRMRPMRIKRRQNRGSSN